VCFSNDIQTVEIPRRAASSSLTSSSVAAAEDVQHLSRRSTSRPVNRQLELPARQVKGRLRSPLATGHIRVSATASGFCLNFSYSQLLCLLKCVSCLVGEVGRVGHGSIFCRVTLVKHVMNQLTSESNGSRGSWFKCLVGASGIVVRVSDS